MMVGVKLKKEIGFVSPLCELQQDFEEMTNADRHDL
jgi:hypothetical protein